jgi:hypothetical protein
MWGLAAGRAGRARGAGCGGPRRRNSCGVVGGGGLARETKPPRRSRAWGAVAARALARPGLAGRAGSTRGGKRRERATKMCRGFKFDGGRAAGRGKKGGRGGARSARQHAPAGARRPQEGKQGASVRQAAAPAGRRARRRAAGAVLRARARAQGGRPAATADGGWLAVGVGGRRHATVQLGVGGWGRGAGFARGPAWAAPNVLGKAGGAASPAGARAGARPPAAWRRRAGARRDWARAPPRWPRAK